MNDTALVGLRILAVRAKSDKWNVYDGDKMYRLQPPKTYCRCLGKIF